MRIAIGQINPCLGDFDKNKKKILDFTKRAFEKKADLIVFPECAIFGYPPYDLLERQAAVDYQLKLIKEIHEKIPKNIGVLFGCLTRNLNKKGKPFFNSAVFLVHQKKPIFFNKELLPTGDVFDEGRYIESGSLSKNFFTWKNKKFFVSICEDIWAWPNLKGESDYEENPLDALKGTSIDLFINLSASPFFVGKQKLRFEKAVQTAKKLTVPVLLCNQVGSQDELIFDGSSFVVDKKGKLILSCLNFQEDLNVFNIDTLESWNLEVKMSEIELLHSALVLGIRDFCQKNNLSHLHLGLSGGIDSALVACLAADALGPSHVTGIALPGPFTSEKSTQCAKELADRLGIHFNEINIVDSFNQIIRTLEDGIKISKFSIVHENLQARLRGLVLMAFSNHKNSLLLNTGNKSELTTGYCTLYGDMCGGLAPIGDLTKSQVYQLSKYYNSQAELIPKFILDRPPSAELAPNQKDTDSLPPYDLLDQAVIRLVEYGLGPKNKTERWVLSKLMQSEFKRWQAPPILKVSSRSFGKGRRYPISHKATRF